jgi:hypothetical protein
MSSQYCWECQREYGRDEVLDIPVFKSGYTVKWCFNCVMKQLEWSDYKLIKNPAKYKKFKVKSSEDKNKEYQDFLEELKLCYEAQFRKIKEIDFIWGELHAIAQSDAWGEEDER